MSQKPARKVPRICHGNAPQPVYGTTNAVYGTTDADAGVGIGMLKGIQKNLIEKAIN